MSASGLDEIDYNIHNFNSDSNESRHPLWVTEKHYVYHLYKDDLGNLHCRKDGHNSPIKSPRKLRNICINTLVCEVSILDKLPLQCIPSNIYPLMLTESIYQREAQAIEWVVSTWPFKILRVIDMVPLEDDIDPEYLTLPFEGNETMCLVDCFIGGLLKLRPESRMQYVDFTRFNKDRKLCKELSRLPILWMTPKDRTVENIHDEMSNSLDITKDKAQRYLNRIAAVYTNVDEDFKHGNNIGPIMIQMDMHMTMDDVPIGLSLQQCSPFNFVCNRLWMKPVYEVGVMPSDLNKILDISNITHFEFEDPSLPQDERKWKYLLEGLGCLKNLVAISLPNSVDVLRNPDMASQLNTCLCNMKNLQRLHFSYCLLKGHVHDLLKNLHSNIKYLNLKDSRLVEEDIFFLYNWQPLSSLCELNLSRNNLMFLDQVVIALLEKMVRLTCLSVSYCSLSTHSQMLIAQECKELGNLKVLAMQGYTPLNPDEITELLNVCCQMPTLQKVLIFPEIYAFPGNNDAERRALKYHMLYASYHQLATKGRIELEIE